MAAHPLSPPALRLRGREQEVATLRQRVRMVASGQGGVVLVTGVAGTGRTSLLTVVEALAEQAGVPVHRGGGEPGGQMQELRERLEGVARRTPLVIIVDDVQSADAGTLIALHTLPSRLSGHAVLWMLGLRAAPRSAAVRAFEHLGAEVLAPAALDDPAVALLTQDVLGAPPGPDLLALAAHERARPVALIELVRGLRDDGLLRVQGGRAHLAVTRAPRRFRDTVRLHLDRLSPRTRAVVETASVLGCRFPVARLAALVDASAVELLAPVREALDAEFFVACGDDLAFRHDLLRGAVDAGLPPTRRRAHRRRLAGLVLDHGEPAPEIAELLADAAEPGDRAAIDVLRRGAAELAVVAPGRAARLAGRALELTPPGDADRAEMVAQAVPLLYAAGRSGEARSLTEKALNGALLPGSLALDLRLARARAQLAEGDFSGARSQMEENLRAARAARDPGAEVAALDVCAAVSFHRHRYREALDRADEAWSVRARHATTGALWPAGWTTCLGGVVGQPHHALRQTDDGLRAARRGDAGPGVPFWLMSRTRLLLTLGRLAEARADAEALIELTGDPGSGGAALNAARYALGCIAIHTGDRSALRAATADAAVMRADPSATARRTGDWLAAKLADADGDHPGAMGLLVDTLDALAGLGPTLSTPQDPLEILDLLRIALRAGEADRATGIVEEIERRAALNPGFPVRALAASHGRGLLERDADAMSMSVSLLDRFDGPLAQALVLEDAAGVLASPARETAVAHLEAALGRLDVAGAERDAHRVRRRLRGLGVRRRRPAAAVAEMGWASLTPSELAVVELVAGGDTNREVAEQLFLSPHTVSSHLRHAFVKVGIRSRVELAVIVAERSEGVDRGQASFALS